MYIQRDHMQSVTARTKNSGGGVRLNRFFSATRSNRVAKHEREDLIESASRVFNRFDSNDASERIKLIKARNLHINLSTRGATEDTMIMMISWISITTPQLVWQSFNCKTTTTYFTVPCLIGPLATLPMN